MVEGTPQTDDNVVALHRPSIKLKALYTQIDRGIVADDRPDVRLRALDKLISWSLQMIDLT